MATTNKTGEGQIGTDKINVTDSTLFTALAELEANDEARAGNAYPKLMKDRAEILQTIKDKLGLESDGVYEFVVAPGGQKTGERRFKASITTTETSKREGSTRKKITPHYDSDDA